MADAAAAPAEPTVEKTTSFLTDLVEHGDKLVAADLPTDVRKVLGSLVSWIDAGGKFVEPEVFNPAASQQVAEEQAESARLAQRVAELEARLSGTAPAPAPATPSPSVPVVQAPPEAAEGTREAQLEAELAEARGQAAPAAPTPPPSS